MFIWLVFFVCDLLAPLIMIAFGRQLWKHPPETVNDEWGYRTKRSRQNADTWRFAQVTGGRWLWRLGWAAFTLSLLVQIPPLRADRRDRRRRRLCPLGRPDGDPAPGVPPHRTRPENRLSRHRSPGMTGKSCCNLPARMVE